MTENDQKFLIDVLNSRDPMAMLNNNSEVYETVMKAVGFEVERLKIVAEADLKKTQEAKK